MPQITRSPSPEFALQEREARLMCAIVGDHRAPGRPAPALRASQGGPEVGLGGGR